MTTSGTYTFTMSRDDIIGAALRLTGAFGDQDVIPATDITNCAQALNILTKSMVLHGLPLWCVETLVIPTVAGQSEYDLSAAAGMPLPPRILDIFIRDESGNDTTLTITSRYDYNLLGQKASQGVPNQVYYDPQLGKGVITLYDVPQDATHTLYVVIQRQLQDFNLSTDNPDFPQEAFRLLKWALADEIALEYQAPTEIRQEIAMRAKVYRDDFFGFEQEQASIFFTPSERGM